VVPRRPRTPPSHQSDAWLRPPQPASVAIEARPHIATRGPRSGTPSSSVDPAQHRAAVREIVRLLPRTFGRRQTPRSTACAAMPAMPFRPESPFADRKMGDWMGNLGTDLTRYACDQDLRVPPGGFEPPLTRFRKPIGRVRAGVVASCMTRSARVLVSSRHRQHHPIRRSGWANGWATRRPRWRTLSSF
jgi:hypothetical protein